jgi:hypothetical protein
MLALGLTTIRAVVAATTARVGPPCRPLIAPEKEREGRVGEEEALRPSQMLPVCHVGTRCSCTDRTRMPAMVQSDHGES